MAGKYQVLLRILCVARGWDRPEYEIVKGNCGFYVIVVVNGYSFTGEEAYELDYAKELAAQEAYNYFK
ncbi:hypothetical protein OnM2_087045 [Erysiphe neolycopersici]|uniref:DRBM domain-containing protein n=1 Tax=Erysiphe neolycopersici TaxID=212602 RepID=A0A420HE35_9PEZI|nr:hypothetical protein OnM2_087045 [Erysiphe neolycopersici]